MAPLAFRKAGFAGGGPAGRAPRMVRTARCSGSSREETVRIKCPSRLMWMLRQSAQIVTTRPV
ncbi:hypothetical protein NWFMUON74_48060 [Nocardia wallacei]|uniref:Uncharacterized protein n=1 Tax=Nocardia wallacei TaxID=480035 RepID=A0A7G1KV80_9NOCA|nr:hypothetical protein NWFMUON74_48060 [Nocardia wallacei]